MSLKNDLKNPHIPIIGIPKPPVTPNQGQTPAITKAVKKVAKEIVFETPYKFLSVESSNCGMKYGRQGLTQKIQIQLTIICEVEDKVKH